ncbi:MAG: PilN domain-containing protein [Thermodesulfobacteriota bacterium]
MIKINLLPKVDVKAPKKGVSELFLGSLALLAVLGVILATHFSQAGKIKKTKNDIKVTQKKIDELKEVEEQVNEFKRKNIELERRIQIIADLETKRSGPLYVMDSLSKAIPDRSWINEFQSKGNGVSLTGVAWNEFTVADFMRELQKSNFYKNVRLRLIEKASISNLPLRKFEITSSLDFLGKKPEPKKNKEDEKKDSNAKESST